MQFGIIGFKHKHELLPESLQCELQTVSNIHSYSTRQKEDIYVSYKRTRLAQFSVQYRAADVWNKLPEEIKQSATLDLFKKQLKENLIKKYSDLV